ncbi:hypothetical protein IE53DRAFT_384643 [Violaceomyces palustris]|uniref:Uncharacterized protein n=1 Tax=Violaceomyces palustris TaxID=1673888 RepID=A0ACD0P4C0_9BASI|nr:hypothetical protein IE53DRAFT_384643 [Violaceomyces palustris]
MSTNRSTHSPSDSLPNFSTPAYKKHFGERPTSFALSSRPTSTSSSTPVDHQDVLQETSNHPQSSSSSRRGNIDEETLNKLQNLGYRVRSNVNMGYTGRHTTPSSFEARRGEAMEEWGELKEGASSKQGLMKPVSSWAPFTNKVSSSSSRQESLFFRSHSETMDHVRSTTSRWSRTNSHPVADRSEVAKRTRDPEQDEDQPENRDPNPNPSLARIADLRSNAMGNSLETRPSANGSSISPSSFITSSFSSSSSSSSSRGEDGFSTKSSFTTWTSISSTSSNRTSLEVSKAKALDRGRREEEEEEGMDLDFEEEGQGVNTPYPPPTPSLVSTLNDRKESEFTTNDSHSLDLGPTRNLKPLPSRLGGRATRTFTRFQSESVLTFPSSSSSSPVHGCRGEEPNMSNVGSSGRVPAPSFGTIEQGSDGRAISGSEEWRNYDFSSWATSSDF